MYTVSLEIINKCNLNCSYCYLGEKNNTFMSLETAQGAINIAVHEALKQYDKTLLVYFIGGEPLMAYQTIKQIVCYVVRECEQYQLYYKFSTTINGTLLTDEITAFLADYDFDVKLSLDGSEKVHDSNRKDYMGKGSFNIIMENLLLLRKYEIQAGKNISVAHVITQNNYEYFADTFSFFIDSGFVKIETAIDQYCTWSEMDKESLGSCLEKVFLYYISYITESKKEIFWNIFTQYVKAYLIPIEFYKCKAGLCSIYISTDGAIYTCRVSEPLKIGTAKEGLNLKRLREIVYIADEINLGCNHCRYLNHCKNRGCIAANYSINNDFYQPVDINCFITQKTYKLIRDNISEIQLDRNKKSLERSSEYVGNN